MPSVCLHAPLYKSHPLWPWRRLSIIAIAVGVFLHLCALANNDSSCAGAVLIFELLSLAYIIWDLLRYMHDALVQLQVRLERQYASNLRADQGPALQETEGSHGSLNIANQPRGDNTEDPKPTWPRRDSTVLDCLFAIVFTYLSIVTFSVIFSPHYYYHGYMIFLIYGNLTTISLAVLHARCFWKQYMARKKAKWEREKTALPRDAYVRCNGTEGESGPAFGAALRSGDLLCCNADCSYQRAERPNKAERPRWMPTYKLPSLFAGRGKPVDLEARQGGPADMGASSGEGEGSLLITPSEDESGCGSKGYGAVGEASTASVPPVKVHTVKKKKGTGKGKEKAVRGSEGEEWA